MSKLKAPTARFYHGAEAEELREKLEELIGEIDNDGAGADESEAAGWHLARRLQSILDAVDARDSLAYVEVEDNEEDEEEYYILSLKDAQGAHCQVLLWWRPDNRGYTVHLESAGRYKASVVQSSLAYYNDGENTLALRCADVERVAHLAVDIDAKHELQKLAPLKVTLR